MHAAQLFDSFLRGPYVEIVEAGLPEGRLVVSVPQTTPVDANRGAFPSATKRTFGRQGCLPVAEGPSRELMRTLSGCLQFMDGLFGKIG